MRINPDKLSRFDHIGIAGFRSCIIVGQRFGRLVRNQWRLTAVHRILLYHCLSACAEPKSGRTNVTSRISRLILAFRAENETRYIPVPLTDPVVWFCSTTHSPQPTFTNNWLLLTADPCHPTFLCWSVKSDPYVISLPSPWTNVTNTLLRRRRHRNTEQRRHYTVVSRTHTRTHTHTFWNSFAVALHTRWYSIYTKLAASVCARVRASLA